MNYIENNINLLIISSNHIFYNKLISNIDFKFINSYFVAHTEENIKNIINKYNIDIIVIESSNIHFIHFIEQNYNELFTNSLIYIGGKFLRKMSNTLIYKELNNNYSTKELMSTCDEIIINKNQKLKEYIYKELDYLGYKFNYNGTRYLAEAIEIIYNSRDETNDNLSKNVYPIIAKKYNKSINNIKVYDNSRNLIYDSSKE